MANPTSSQAFIDSIGGTDWLDVAEVFPYMCPDTGRNCHSLCICYHDDREGAARDGETSFRVDGYTRGECVKYGARIGAARDEATKKSMRQFAEFTTSYGLPD